MPFRGAWLRKLSLLLFALSEAELLLANLIVLLHGKFIWPFLLLPVGWPLYYGLVYLIVSVIAKTDPNSPRIKNYPRMPGQLVSLSQPQLIAAIAYLTFPVMMTLVAAITVYAAFTNQIHPLQ
ncbi:MAG: hypothetical protein ACTHN5_10300 [Phycisphaerae bacterium]